MEATGQTARSALPDDSVAVELRGFGPAGIMALLVILLTGNFILDNMFVLPVGATLVLVWTRWSRTPWAELGLARPRSWFVTVVGGLVFGVAFKLFLKAIVLPLLGAEPVNPAYHFLAGNRALLPTAIWGMFAAGFGEELVFRGYLFERLRRLCGTGPRAQAGIVLFTSLWFGAAHYFTQGLTGVEQAAIVGLVFGAIAMRTGRIWLLMIAHTAFDLTALALIYGGWETLVARLVFK